MKKIVRIISVIAILLTLAVPCMAVDDPIIGPSVTLINGVEFYTDGIGSYILDDDGNRCPAELAGDTIVYIDPDWNTVYVGPDGERSIMAPAVAIINGIEVYTGANGVQWTYDADGNRCLISILESGKLAYLDSNHNIVFYCTDGAYYILGAITKTRNGIELYEDWAGNWYTDDNGMRCAVIELENGDLSYTDAEGCQVIIKPNGEKNTVKLMPDTIYLFP